MSFIQETKKNQCLKGSQLKLTITAFPKFIILFFGLFLTGCFQYTSPGLGAYGPLKNAQSMYHSGAGASPSLKTELTGNLSNIGPRDENYYFYDVKFLSESELTNALAQHNFILGDYARASDLFQSSFDLVENGENRFFQYTKQKKQEMKVYQSFINMIGNEFIGQLSGRNKILTSQSIDLLEGTVNTGKLPEKDDLFIGEALLERTSRRVLSGEPAFDMGGIAHISNGIGRCTGFHIAPGGLVLTNAHCVEDPNGNRISARNMIVRFDRPAFALDLPVRKIHFNDNYKRVKRGASRKKWIQAFEQDWAILELDTVPLTGVFPIAVTKKNTDGSVEAGPIGDAGKGMVAGYSADLNDGRFLSLDVGCNWEKSKKYKLIIHNCETWKGSSGAPILTVTNNSISYFGINAGHIGKRQVAVPISSFADKLNELLTRIQSPQNKKKKLRPEQYEDFFRYYYEIRKSVFGDVS